MLSPLLQPPEIQYPMRVKLPPYLQDYRVTLLRHPAAQWAAQILPAASRRSAEVSRRSAAGADAAASYHLSRWFWEKTRPPP